MLVRVRVAAVVVPVALVRLKDQRAVGHFEAAVAATVVLSATAGAILLLLMLLLVLCLSTGKCLVVVARIADHLAAVHHSF